MIDALILLGLFFLGVGTLGLLKLSDALERMHATSEATTLGVGFMVLAAAIDFYPDGVYLSALLALFFLFLTAPTGAHMIARATYVDENRDKEASLNDFV
ncbi:monovalent cation/H(+) antiporter subunit G [Candidatus Nanosalina sp. VS9-1]|uniref:monovalent cation/H(+) antiporter subunit G n=1 Tax=Candidatus Nanosalina sp. VS9-1 TaxID=3388566 RepID=UPI0039DFAFEB